MMLASEGMEVVAELASIEQAIENTDGFTDIDVILIKAEPEIRDYSILSDLRDTHGHARIVLVASRQLGPDPMLAAIAAGADGILLAELSPEAFLQSLRLICLGERVLPAQLATLLLNRDRHDRLVPNEVREIGLSNRELQILELLARGYANKEIAIELDIAEATVKVHVKAVLRKIRVGNRTQAAVWALGHGLAASSCRH